MKKNGVDENIDSFVILDDNYNINTISLSNSEKTVESIYIPVSKKTKKIPYKDNPKDFPKYKRSESNSRISSIYIDKKKSEYFNLEFEVLEDNKKETIKPFKSKCTLYDKKNNAIEGILTIDKNYICTFTPDENKNKNNMLYYNSDYYSFSLMYIKNIIPNTNLLGQITYYMEINLKDCRSFLFKLDMTTYHYFINTISTYAKPDKNYFYYEKAFSYKINNIKNKKNNHQEKIIDYWDLYNIEKEFERQEVDFKSKKPKYYLIDNSSFNICESYPKQLIVPNLGTKNILEDIQTCADFRTKKRLPVLTYRYKNGICIWRCSQTKSGFNGKNEKDILLLTKISDNKKLIIYDCRPKLNAWVNKLKGAGYENKGHYNKIIMDIKFCDIPNIHAVRTSFESVFNGVSYYTGTSSQSQSFDVISNLINSQWYDTIILILKSGFNIYNSVKKDKNTVLIHCSDGWDRTSQLSTISQILLDNYYRTLEGFIILIEKDWMSFGHQFRYRNGFYSTKDTPSNICKENQFSPVFIQWLDCVYQLMQQNMDKFQFNENLLTFIAEQVYEGKYGNFLFNNEKERKELNMRQKTESIWGYILENKKKFLNPIYKKHKEEEDSEFEINYKKIKLWEDYFLRFEKGDKKGAYIDLINKKFREYKKEIKHKQKIIEEMGKLILEKNKKLLTPEMKKELGIKEEENDIQKDKKNEFSFVIMEKDDFEETKK